MPEGGAVSSQTMRYWQPPLSPIVEATLSLITDATLAKQESLPSQAAAGVAATAELLMWADFAAIEARILASGHRFAWSAQISRRERPEAYEADAGAGQSDIGFAHPEAPSGDADASGRALRGVGDNVVRYERNVTGIARYIRTSAEVLSYLTNGVASQTVAIIDDSGGTLTAPIIEQFAGVICAGGTVRSHLGILTREYNIPCLMNAKVAGIRDGDQIMIETSAAARTTEDYQRNVQRTARIWLLETAAGV